MDEKSVDGALERLLDFRGRQIAQLERENVRLRELLVHKLIPSDSVVLVRSHARALARVVRHGLSGLDDVELSEVYSALATIER